MEKPLWKYSTGAETSLKNGKRLKNLASNPGTGLGIGEGVVVVREVVTATGGDDVEIVMPFGPLPARSDKGTKEPVIGIIHLIGAEYRLETMLVKCLVVSH